MRQSYTDPCVRPLREEGAELTATEVGYERVQGWVKARLQQTHATVVQTITWAVLCVVVAQRVTPAAVARALPAEQAGGGRSGGGEKLCAPPLGVGAGPSPCPPRAGGWGGL